MRIVLLFLFLVSTNLLAEELPQCSVDRMNAYKLALALALEEKKNLCVWIKSDAVEGICDIADRNTVCVSVKSFLDCQDGDAVYSEYRSGGWHQWVKTINKDGSVVFNSKPTLKKNNIQITYSKIPTFSSNFYRSSN